MLFFRTCCTFCAVFFILEQVGEEVPYIMHAWNVGTEKLVNPDDHLYFLTKAFPFLFMPATVMIDGKEVIDVPTDFNCKLHREKPISWAQYAAHMTKINHRFMDDASFKFVLFNIKNTKSIFSQINWQVRH